MKSLAFDINDQESAVCPLWSTHITKRRSTDGDYYEFFSERAGGRFQITGTALSADLKGKARQISKEILESNLRGEIPKIDTYTVQNIPDFQEYSASKKYDLFIKSVSIIFSKLGERFCLEDLWYAQYGFFLQAAIGSASTNIVEDRGEIEWLARSALEKGHFIGNDNYLALSIDAFSYIENLGASLRKSDQIFVAMWFGDEQQSKLYYEAIKPAIEAAGYFSLRIDNSEHNEKIDDQIIAEIRKSRAVVVDLTCGLARPEGWGNASLVGAPRGGVFYEAGFAKGIGLPVIWTIRQDIADIENVVHFDIRQFNQIRWSSNLKDFSERLTLRIESTLGRGNFST